MLSSTDESAPFQPAPTTRDVWNRRLVFLRIILITVILVGILFWLSSMISFSLPMEYQPLVSAIALAGGYLFPGYMLKSKKEA